MIVANVETCPDCSSYKRNKYYTDTYIGIEIANNF